MINQANLKKEVKEWCRKIPVESYWLRLALIESARLYSFYDELKTWPEYLKMSQLHFLFNFTLSSRKIESFRVVGWRPWPAPLQPFQLIWPKLILKICTKLWPIIASILQNTFDRTKYYIFTLQVPTRVVTTVPAKEPRLDQQPIKSALKKVLLIVSYVWYRLFYQRKSAAFFCIVLENIRLPSRCEEWWKHSTIVSK